MLSILGKYNDFVFISSFLGGVSEYRVVFGVGLIFSSVVERVIVFSRGCDVI